MTQPTFENQPTPDEIERRIEGFTSWLEVDLDHLGFNLERIRERVGVGVEIMPVVKNNAYGHGLLPIASYLYQHGVRWFLVAKRYEAERLRARCPESRVLLMDALFGDETYQRVVANRITLAVFTTEAVDRLAAAAARLGIDASVFVKVDTGLRRVGVKHTQAADFVEKVSAVPGVTVDGLFSSFMQHPDEDRNMLARFNEVVSELGDRGIKPAIRTMASTNAIFHSPDAWLTMVRPAMCLFGVYPFPGDDTSGLALKQVVSLKARIELVKPVDTGESVTYFGTFEAPQPMRVGTLHVGFFDGLPRELANKLKVSFGDTVLPGVGTIALNHCLVDVTAVDAQAGDAVTIYSHRGEASLNAMSSAAGWMPYSIMNHLNPMTPRVYRQNGRPVALLDPTGD